MKRNNWLILGIMMVLVFAACAASAETTTTLGTVGDATTTTGPKELHKFTIVLPHTVESMDEMLVYLGLKLGYFEEEGLDLIVINADNPTDVQMTAIGQADLCVPSPSVLMTQIQAGLDVILVGNYQPINIFGYAVPNDSSIQSFDDFKQDMSILLGNPAWESIAHPSLNAIGLDPKKMDYVVGGDARWAMLMQKQADLLLTWVSEFYQMQGMGYNDTRFFCANDVLPCIANGWVAAKDTLEEKGPYIAAFMRACAKSIYAQYADPNAAADAVLTQFPGLDITWEGAMNFAKGRVYHQFGMNADLADYFTNEVGIMHFTTEDIQNTLDYMRKSEILVNDNLVASDLFTNDYVPGPYTQADTDKIKADCANYVYTSKIYLDWKAKQP